MEQIDQNIISRKILTKIFILLFFAGWVWLFYFNLINSPFQRDEGEYAYSAWLLREGGIPYKEAFMQKPPMIIYTYYLAQTVSKKVSSPRMLAFIFITLTGLILGDLTRRIYNKESALTVLILFPAILFLPALQAISAQPEIFLLLPLVASWWCYIQSEESADKKLRWLLATGALSAIALLYKPIVLPAVAFLFIYIFIKTLLRAGLARATIEILSISISAVSTTLIVLLLIMARGGLSSMIEETILFNMQYASVVKFSPTFGLTFILSVWPLFALSLWYLFKISKNKFLFLGLFVALLLGTLGSCMGHYYIIIVPAMTLLCSATLADFAEKFYGRKIISRQLFFTLMSAVIISALLIIPTIHRFSLTPLAILKDTYDVPEFEAALIIAKKIKPLTSPKDLIFIDGSDPEILYYVCRKSATKFVIKYPLSLPTSLSEKYKREEISELEANPPEVIVTPITPFYIKQELSRLKKLDALNQYLIPLLNKDYEFISAISLIDKNNNSFISYSTIQPQSSEIQYLVIYKKISR
jgi:hypothetical protein